MTRYAAVLSLILFWTPAAIACSGTANLSPDLAGQIEAKFPGLSAGRVSFHCGGSAVQFQYVPSENLVPGNSFFKDWNKSFVLGDIRSDDDLRAMLALTPEQMQALIAANVSFIQDSYEAENHYGVSAYDPNALPSGERFSGDGVLMYVTSSHCRRNGWSTNSEQLGEIHLPVYSLDAVSIIGRAPLYRKGDLMRAITGNPAVLQNLKTVAVDNLAAQDSDAKDDNVIKMNRARMCSEGMEPGSAVSWQDTLRLQPATGGGAGN